jgi:hypothetical protein
MRKYLAHCQPMPVADDVDIYTDLYDKGYRVSVLLLLLWLYSLSHIVIYG